MVSSDFSFSPAEALKSPKLDRFLSTGQVPAVKNCPSLLSPVSSISAAFSSKFFVEAADPLDSATKKNRLSISAEKENHRPAKEATSRWYRNHRPFPQPTEQSARLSKRTASYDDPKASLAALEGGILRRAFSTHVSERDFINNTFPQIPQGAPCLYTGERISLPHHACSSDAIKRIAPATLVSLLRGGFSDSIDEVHVLDCRFAYEFEGGHIDRARNVNTVAQMENFLFDGQQAFSKKTALVFHCEFSSYRAPRMALHIRKTDRRLNQARYPALFFPEIYVLEGGYKQFYSEFGECCVPRNYVEMDSAGYKSQSQRLLQQFRASLCDKKRSSIPAMALPSIEEIAEPDPLPAALSSDDISPNRADEILEAYFADTFF